MADQCKNRKGFQFLNLNMLLFVINFSKLITSAIIPYNMDATLLVMILHKRPIKKRFINIMHIYFLNLHTVFVEVFVFVKIRAF